MLIRCAIKALLVSLVSVSCSGQALNSPDLSYCIQDIFGDCALVVIGAGALNQISTGELTFEADVSNLSSDDVTLSSFSGFEARFYGGSNLEVELAISNPAVALSEVVVATRSVMLSMDPLGTLITDMDGADFSGLPISTFGAGQVRRLTLRLKGTGNLRAGLRVARGDAFSGPSPMPYASTVAETSELRLTYGQCGFASGSLVTCGLLGSLSYATPQGPQVVQLNQANASLLVAGGNEIVPGTTTEVRTYELSVQGGPYGLTLDSALAAGGFYDCAIQIGAVVLPGVATVGGQFINLGFGPPAPLWLSSGSPSGGAPFPPLSWNGAAATFPLQPPVPLLVHAQAYWLDPSQAAGFSLSGPANIDVVP